MDSRRRLHDHRHHGRVVSGERLSVESLPLIDTRLLSQSELLSLSLCSPLSSSSSSSASLAASAGGDDDLTPKIDRSVFNESAGSRKQTFLRLRLARHPPPPRPPSSRRQLDESSFEENSQVVSLLRSLFSIGSSPRKTKENGGEEEGHEEYEHEDSEGQRLFPVPINFFSNVYQDLNLDSVQSVLVQMISGNETRRKRGRPRKIRSPSDRAIVIGRGEGVEASDVSNWIEALPYSNSIAMETRETSFEETPIEDLGLQRRDGASIFFTDPNSNTLSTLQVKKKRGRPPKNRDSVNQVGVSRNCEDKEPLDLQNRDGAMVDLLTLANAEDPYGEELRRRTMGLQTKAELLGFLAQLRGEWVNAGKKKRVVEASDFGDTLPRGWKLMLCVKQKAGDVWLACRRYMSPNGQQFATCKEVSAHLISILEAQGEKNQSRIRRHPHGMFYESSAGVRGDHGGMSEDPVETNLVGMGGNAVLDLVGRDNLKKSMMIDFFSREGEMVVNKELVELSSSEAMYGEKLRKMTQGLATTEELLQFWSS